MAKTTVSSIRIKSMLTNRNKDIDQVKSELGLRADLATIVKQDTELDFGDIQAIAKYFKKPWSYLLIEDAEVFPKKDQDNRTHNNQQKPVSADILEELQIANFMLDTSIEIFPKDKVLRPDFTLSTSSDVSAIAGKVRKFLSVSLAAQLAVKDEYEALRLWAEAIQNKGVYISQRRLRDETIRAFSLTRNNHALMVVDTGDTPYARIFSILHEYCHVLLKNTGICDLDEHSTTERFCNEFSAEVLLPMDLIDQELRGLSFTNNLEEDEETIRTLSNHFRVSQAVLLIRLNGIGLVSDSLYSKLETRRRNKTRGRKGSGGDFYRTKINAVGKKYAQNVFSALSEGSINRSDASVLLGVGEHLVDRFKSELFQPPPSRTSAQ